jgi:hypothetical protein
VDFATQGLTANAGAIQLPRALQGFGGAFCLRFPHRLATTSPGHLVGMLGLLFALGVVLFALPLLA